MAWFNSCSKVMKAENRLKTVKYKIAPRQKPLMNGNQNATDKKIVKKLSIKKSVVPGRKNKHTKTTTECFIVLDILVDICQIEKYGGFKE